MASRFSDLDCQPTTARKTLHNSNFFLAYRQTRRVPTVEDVVTGLRAANQHEAANIFQSASGNVPMKAVRLWTSNAIYKVLNQCLMKDQHMEAFASLIRAINCWITANPFQQRCRTFRGSKVTPQQFSLCRKGEVYRPPYFIASSVSLNQAFKFLAPGSPIIVFDIPAGCRNAAEISALNVYGENEILIPPYTPLKLTLKGQITDRKTGIQHPCLQYSVLDCKAFEAQVERPIFAPDFAPNKRRRVEFEGRPARVEFAAKFNPFF